MTTSISSTVVSEEGLEAYSLMMWTLPPRRKYSSLWRVVPKLLCLVTFPLWKGTATTPSHQRKSYGSSFGEDGEYWRSKRIHRRWIMLVTKKWASSSWLQGLCPVAVWVSLPRWPTACQTISTLCVRNCFWNQIPDCWGRCKEGTSTPSSVSATLPWHSTNNPYKMLQFLCKSFKSQEMPLLCNRQRGAWCLESHPLLQPSDAGYRTAPGHGEHKGERVMLPI